MRTFSSLLLLAAVAVAVCSADEPRFRLAQRQHFGSGKFARQQIAPDAVSDTTADPAPYAPTGSQRPGREFPLPTETEAPFDGNDADGGDDDRSEQTTTVASTTTDGPYAPSGWQPAGRLLTLPSFQRQQQQQQQPGQLYGAPSHEYGAPETTTDSTEFGETEASAAAETNETTDEPESELLPGSAQLKGQQRTSSATPKVQKQQRQQQQLEQYAAPATYFVQLPNGQLQQIAAPSAAFYQLPGVPTVSAGLLSAQLQQQQPQFVQFGQLVASPSAVSYSQRYRAEKTW